MMARSGRFNKSPRPVLRSPNNSIQSPSPLTKNTTRNKMREAITFDDVLLEPQFSDIKSRSEVDISSELGTLSQTSVKKLTISSYSASIVKENAVYKMPVISSPMDTITGGEMASAMFAAGGLGIIHRYNSIEEQADIVKKLAQKDKGAYIAAAIGATGDYLERAQELVSKGADILCIDVAHGHHKFVEQACKKIKEDFKLVHLMAGNVATIQGFTALENWGADSIRVGVGGGSICSTRVRTGHGIPTLQSVINCASVARNAKIVADGGLRTSGDIVKALAAGADFVMLGSMLAGSAETPGEKQLVDDKYYKKYRGMASKEAQTQWRGFCSVEEGISTVVPFKGSVLEVLSEIEGGIRSGLSYSGARNLTELRAFGKFIRQTNSGKLEGNTHILF